MSNSTSAPGPPKNKGRPIKSTREDREQLRAEFLEAVNKKNGLTGRDTLSVKQLQTLLIANHCPRLKCSLNMMYHCFGSERQDRRPPTEEILKAMKRALRPGGVLWSTLSKVAAVEARALRNQLKKDVDSVLKNHHVARSQSLQDPGPSTASLGIGSFFIKPDKKNKKLQSCT